jgi:hypothetical protein
MELTAGQCGEHQYAARHRGDSEGSRNPNRRPTEACTATPGSPVSRMTTMDQAPWVFFQLSVRVPVPAEVATQNG